MERIDSFRGEWRFLSNFWILENPVLYEKSEFYATENAYVAAKTVNPTLWQKIQTMKPGEAKAFGKKIMADELSINPEWSDDFRLALMKNLVRQKFLNNPELADKLIATGNAELIEGNTWHDNFFGVCKCGNCPPEKLIEGGSRNYLGVSLTETRGFLQRRL